MGRTIRNRSTNLYHDYDGRSSEQKLIVTDLQKQIDMLSVDPHSQRLRYLKITLKKIQRRGSSYQFRGH